MRRRQFLRQAAAALLTPLAVRAAVPPTPTGSADGRFTVHEWGTFLSVQGSDGSTLGGMVDSEDKLPDFVRERSLAGYSRSRFFQKAETPVTYFYSDRPRKVQVRVDMPEGLLTHWFPSVRKFGPDPVIRVEPDGRVIPDYDLRPDPKVSSFLDWNEFDILPTVSDMATGVASHALSMRPVAKDDHWRFARETDACMVRIGQENPGTRRGGDYEKFLFYRGLGTFDLPLCVHSDCCKSFLNIDNRGPEVLNGLHLLRVAKDSIEFGTVDDIPGKSGATVSRSVFGDSRQPLRTGIPQAKEVVAASLVKAGLYPKEAWAMVNTWEKSYFQTEGLRLLYIVPRLLVDRIFPLHVKPTPQDVVRVMVGRVEILTPDRERQIEKAVRDLGSRNPRELKDGQLELDRLGRIREPALHRVAALTQDAEIRARALELIRTMDKVRC